jgi:large subunit ribosomal protein L10
MPTPQKEAIIQDLAEQFRAAKSLLFADYRGLDVEALSELRRRCRDENVRFRVAKNTLSKLAMAEIGVHDADELLTGPTGLAISDEDELAAARVLVQFAKENDKLGVKGGVMEGRICSLDEVIALATLPPKDQLLAQLLATIESPLVDVIRAAETLVQDVLSCAEQAAEQKGGAESAPAAAESEPPAEASGDAPAAAGSAEPAPAAESEADAASDEAATPSDETATPSDETAADDDPPAPADPDSKEA